MAVYRGRIGQLDDTFAAGQEIIPLIVEKHQLTNFYGLTKVGIQAPVGTRLKINEEPLRIGATGIYELDNIVNILQLSFVNETTALIDYVF